MASIAIVHNIPIHYKHLLFIELTRIGLDCEVLFTGSASSARLEKIPLDQRLYRHRVGFDGRCEDAPVLSTVKFIWKALAESNPRLVVISGWRDVASWTAWAWSLIHRKPRILWAESNAFDHPRSSWKEAVKRCFIARFQGAHVYGTHSREYLLRLGMPPDRIEIKRAVVNVDLYGSAAVGAHKCGPLVLLYVGRLSPEKNLERLVRALEGVAQDQSDPRLVLAIVGYGPLEQALRNLAADLGITKLVQFWGAAKQTEMPAVYRRADALILPSTSEPWGLVALEAMCSGLPVIVSDRCGCSPDVVTPETGWTFPAFDQHELTSLLERLSRMPRRDLEKMGPAARRLAAEYSPAECARKILSSIRGVLGEAPGASLGVRA